MYQPLVLAVGIRYLTGRRGDPFGRFISLLSTLGISLGVTALIVVLSVMNGFESQLKQRLLGVTPQAIVVAANQSSMPNSPIPTLSIIENVKAVQPIVNSGVVFQSSNALGAGKLLGIASLDPIANYITVGSLENLKTTRYGVILGMELINQLGLRIGDKVKIIVPSVNQYTPLGRIPSQRNFILVGAFYTGSDIDANYAYTNIGAAARLLHYKKDYITGWRLFLKDPFKLDSLHKNLNSKYKINDWREERGEFFQAVKMERNMMTIMLGLVIFIAAFNVISSLIMVVMDKRAEIAILKTLGVSSSQIMNIFIIRGACSGVIGSLLGGILGTIATLNINQILSWCNANALLFMGGLPTDINYIQIVVIIIFAITLTILATLYPAYRAAKYNPIEALRYE